MKRLLRLLASPLGAAPLLALADGLVGHLRAEPGALDWPEELGAVRITLAVVLVLHGTALGLGHLLVPSARERDPATLGLAVSAGLAAFLAEVDFLEWNAAHHDPMLLRNGVFLGLLSGGLLWHLLGGRVRSAPLGRGLGTGALALVPLLAIAPSLPLSPKPRTERAVRRGHRIPHVILIIADTLRRDALSTYSQHAAPTPVLDAFGAQGLTYTRARTPGAWTLPSVTSALTGLHPLVHGAMKRNSSLPDQVTPLAARMAEAGYRTAAIGHNFVLSPPRHLYRGFDAYEFTSRRMLPTPSFGFLVLAWIHDRTTPRGEPDAEEINARAFRWLDNHADEDFFLWLHYYDTHIVYDPPTDLRPEGPPPPGLSFAFTYGDLENVRGGYKVLDAEGRRWVRALYDAESRGLDRSLGLLFDDLKRRGLWEDSLVIVTSDHGEEFFEHEGFEHGHAVYEELLDVPLFVKLPHALAEAQRAAGTYPARLDTPVSLENITPTILTLTGIDADPGEFSAGPLLDPTGAPIAAPTCLHASTGTLYFQDRLAVMVSDFKYIRLLSGREELYDLASDPGETRNLVPQAPPELELGCARFEEVRRQARAQKKRLGISAGTIRLDAAEMRRLRDIGYAR